MTILLDSTSVISNLTKKHRKLLELGSNLHFRALLLSAHMLNFLKIKTKSNVL